MRVCVCVCVCVQLLVLTLRPRGHTAAAGKLVASEQPLDSMCVYVCECVRVCVCAAIWAALKAASPLSP